MPRSARPRHHETTRRTGDGAVERKLRAMSSRAGPAIRVRTRGAPRGLHGLPHSAWLDQRETARRTRCEPLFEMSCAGAKRERPQVHRKAGSLRSFDPGHVLERGLPPGHTRVKHEQKNALLKLPAPGLCPRNTYTFR